MTKTYIIDDLYIDPRTKQLQKNIFLLTIIAQQCIIFILSSKHEFVDENDTIISKEIVLHTQKDKLTLCCAMIGQCFGSIFHQSY